MPLVYGLGEGYGWVSEPYQPQYLLHKDYVLGAVQALEASVGTTLAVAKSKIISVCHPPLRSKLEAALPAVMEDCVVDRLTELVFYATNA